MEDTTYTEDQSQGRGRCVGVCRVFWGPPAEGDGYRRDLGDWQREKILRGQAGGTLWQALNDTLGHLVSVLPAIERKPKV